VSLAQQHALRIDVGLVQEAIRAGITSKRASAHDNHWTRWVEFCLQLNVDPHLSNISDPVPLLQVFTQRYRDGRIAPSQATVKSRTAEDALRAVGQAFSLLGTKDPRKDAHGNIDFRITRQLRAYNKTDTPPRRVKPLPISIILHILNAAHNLHPTASNKIISDVICIAFYFLLRPGEYTGTTADDHPFLLRDVSLHLGTRTLNIMTDPLHLITAATACSYKFTRQKNGTENEVVTHGRSDNLLCCPTRATIRLVLYHRQHNTAASKPLASYYHRNKLTPVTPTDVTERIRSSANALRHATGIDPSELSARSLRAGGAMALLCGNIDTDVIQLFGRWHSDAMLRYLHVQAEPVMKKLARIMFNHGQYSFHSTDTVPIVDDN